MKVAFPVVAWIGTLGSLFSAGCRTLAFQGCGFSLGFLFSA
jgi:hypothetical protein